MDVKRKVLIVEDEASIRRGLEDVFTYHGYDVVAFSDGESAWAYAEEAGRFDLAVLDVMLPGIDGFELCGRFRAARPSTPILMLTAKGESMAIFKAQGLGAADYLLKPCDADDLMATVQKFCGA